MERKIGSTQLRRSLTDVLQAVKEEQAAYVIETFDRSQAVLISLDEYQLLQRCKTEHGAQPASGRPGPDDVQPASERLEDGEAAAILNGVLADLVSMAAVAGPSLDLTSVIERLEDLAQQQRQASLPQGALGRILGRAADLGIPDLAEQHDHYLYGSEKR